MVDCSVCGKPIIDEPYVVDDRRVRHLHHDGSDQIQTSEYEKIILVLRGQAELSLLETDAKNKIILENIQDYRTLEEQHKKILEERHKCFDELSIYKTDYEKLRAEMAKIPIEVNEANMNLLKKEIEELKTKVAAFASLEKQLKKLGLENDSKK